MNHECSLSEFEKLGASKERRPGENIHLTNHCMALKVQAAYSGCKLPLVHASCTTSQARDSPKRQSEHAAELPQSKS